MPIITLVETDENGKHIHYFEAGSVFEHKDYDYMLGYCRCGHVMRTLWIESDGDRGAHWSRFQAV